MTNVISSIPKAALRQTVCSRAGVLGGALLASAMLLAGGVTAPSMAEGAKAQLTVTVKGVETAEGVVMVGLFSGVENYDGGVVTHGAAVDAIAPETVVVFEDLTPGEYALKVYHDVDGDGEMGTNTLGIPNEPYGFSNDARGRFGPAGYDKAKFTLEAGLADHTLTVK